MSDDQNLDELIKEIALKNGVAVDRRDPIMIVHTMNTRLLAEGRKAQKEALDALKSELEEIAHRWGEEAKGKAEKIINAALAASKEAMVNGMQEGAKRAAADLERLMAQSGAEIASAAKNTTRAAYVNLAASVLVVIAVTVALIRI